MPAGLRRRTVEHAGWLSEDGGRPRTDTRPAQMAVTRRPVGSAHGQRLCLHHLPARVCPASSPPWVAWPPQAKVCNAANISDQPLKRCGGRPGVRAHPSMGGCSPTSNSSSTTRRRKPVMQQIVGRRGPSHITVGTTRIRRTSQPPAPSPPTAGRSHRMHNKGCCETGITKGPTTPASDRDRRHAVGGRPPEAVSPRRADDHA